MIRTLPGKCPKCSDELTFASGLDEYMCNACMWAPGEPGCNTGYLPEHMYAISDYCTILGMLYKQLKANQITYVEFGQIVDNLGVSG